MKMTLEQAHKMLDEEYAKNEVAQIGIRKGKIPDSVRVAAALINVTEKAKMESPFFSMPRITEGEERAYKKKNDNWSGAQGNITNRISEEQERGNWGIYG